MNQDTSASTWNMTSDPHTSEVGLPPDALMAVFPFHFAIGPDLTVRQVGPSLARVMPDLKPGDALTDHLAIVRPPVPLQYSSLIDQPRALFLLRALHAPLKLRGQLLRVGAGTPEDRVVFLGSPQINDLAGLAALNLTVDDFAPHDPALDFVFLLQTNATTVDDLRRNSDRLTAERSEARDARTRLQHLLRASPTVIFSVRIDDLSTVFISENATRVIGETPADLGTGFLHDRVHVDDITRLHGALEHARAFGDTSCVVRMSTQAGDARWHQVTLHRTVDDQGQPIEIVGALQDVDAMIRTEMALRASESDYRLLVDKVKEVIFRTDAQGLWTFLNPAWTDITGFTLDESLGKLFLDYVHPDDRQRNNDLFAPLIARKKDHCQHEVRYLTADGGYRWIDVYARLIIDENGETVGTTGTLSDITERFETAEQLRRAKETAEAANQAKSDFLALVSHEIRTPLHQILGMTELALSTDLTTEQREFIQSVQSSSDALSYLLDDHLDFAKIEAGQMKLELVSFSPGELLEGVVESMGMKAASKGIELTCWIDPWMPRRMTGDPHRLRQIATNLVGNAVKFTPRGEVVLQVRCTPSEDGEQHRLHLTVTDTGIGIPLEDQAHVFERFYQSRPSKGRHPGGTGLGLSITHSLVELMGGTILLTSTVGKGTRLEVNLTLAADVTSRRPTRPHPPASRGRVLLVSPKMPNTGMLRAHLEWSGFAVTLATAWPPVPLTRDGLCAIVACTPPPPDLLGTENAVPWIGIGPSAQFEGSSPAPKRLLAKPLRPGRLLAALDELLDRRADVAIVSPAAAPAAQPIRQAATATILLAEDNPDNQRFAVHVLATAGHIVHVAHDGQEAADRAAAYRYDLILMDLQMPIMDGNLATTAIRRDEHQREATRVPIVVLTAHAVEGFREQCLKIGADDYATKPLRRGRLLEIVNLWADTRPAILVLRTAPQAVAAARQFVRAHGRRFRLHVASDVQSFSQELEHQSTGLALIDALSPDAPTLLGHVRARARAAGTPVVGLLPDHINPVVGALGAWARELDALIPLAQAQSAMAALARDAKAAPTADETADASEFDFAPELADLAGGYVEKRVAELDVLEALLNQGDFERVRWIGHDLKGSGGTYGLPEITRLGDVLAASAADRDRTAIEQTIAELSALLDRARTHLHAKPPRP